MRSAKFAALSVVLILGVLLSACSALGIGGQVPTLDPAAQQATIGAAVTQTMQAVAFGQTSTALAFPSSTPTITETIAPTATFTPLATWTPIAPTFTNTPKPTIAKPTATATQANYSCEVTSTSPTAGTKITVNTDFDAAWVVKNTGIKNWEVGYVDLRYVDGTKMQTKADLFDITTAVAKGSTLNVIVDMKAPATAGKYSANWILTMEGTVMCKLTVNIEAVNP